MDDCMIWDTVFGEVFDGVPLLLRPFEDYCSIASTPIGSKAGSLEGGTS